MPDPAPAPRPGGRRVAGVTTRLVALVMLPVTVMCGLIVSQVVPRWSTAAAALAIDRDVVELSALVDLHAAMSAQRALASFYVRSQELGVTPEYTAELVGIDMQEETGRARARTDRAFAQLGDASPVPQEVADSLYVGVGGVGWTAVERDERFDRVEGPIVAALSRRLAALESAARRTNAGSLLTALDSLRLTDRIIGAAAPQGIDLSAVWFPSPSQSTAVVLTDLGAESQIYASGSRRIRELGEPSVVAGLDAIEGHPQVATYNLAIATVLRGESLVLPDETANQARAGEVFRGYVLRTGMLEELADTATAAVRRGAQNLAASERQAFIAWAVAAALLTLTTLAVAVAFARSIARPLRDLADYAHAVKDGRLDADPADGATRGPREIRVAGTAFVELVANLQLLDAKANALATCAFDDPVLDQPLPGRLGSSLKSSVAILSSSIVERDRLQTHLRYQATHDALTGIPNRAAAVTGIHAAIQRAGRHRQPMAVLFVDLNEFKSVNDRHGHEAGDEVLRTITRRMSAQLRDTDAVARLGGDEFVVVAERIGGETGAVDLAQRIIDVIGEPIDVGAHEVTVGAAVGVVLSVDDPADPLDLLARADAAMHRAKGHDRSAIEIFNADLQRKVVEREAVEHALTHALAEPGGGGLVLHYQPVISAGSGAVAGVEALIRWERPGHGFLPPDAFIPVAEASTLIIDLDRWVLAQACHRLVDWSTDPDLADVPIAVNISGRHLQSGRLPGHIAEVLSETGVEAHRLTIEITETVLLDDLGAAAVELEAVRRLGIRVAIDDFGTGYTSLAHLQHLPIDTIKIDRSFTSQLDVTRGRSLVRMVTDVGHAIDLEIVAEGVETTGQLEVLQFLGADQLQGFLFSRALPPDALRDWVRERADSTVDMTRVGARGPAPGAR